MIRLMPYNKTIVFCFLFLVAGTGCAKKIPCYPPDHYAPEFSAPYTAEEVRIPTSNGHILAGTLTLPSGGDPPYPAVLLITGSSPQERDHLGTTEKPFSYYKPFRQIADAATRKGIAVLRMDDQGVGCSQGGPLEKATIQERADDSRAAIAYLRDRKEIDERRIGLLGLSEGANIGPMIAASDTSIGALVMMAASATNGYRILEYQRRLKIFERSDRSDNEKEQALAQSMRGLDRALARGEGGPWFFPGIHAAPHGSTCRLSCVNPAWGQGCPCSRRPCPAIG